MTSLSAAGSTSKVSLFSLSFSTSTASSPWLSAEKFSRASSTGSSFTEGLTIAQVTSGPPEFMLLGEGLTTKVEFRFRFLEPELLTLPVGGEIGGLVSILSFLSELPVCIGVLGAFPHDMESSLVGPNRGIFGSEQKLELGDTLWVSCLFLLREVGSLSQGVSSMPVESVALRIGSSEVSSDRSLVVEESALDSAVEGRGTH